MKIRLTIAAGLALAMACASPASAVETCARGVKAASSADDSSAEVAHRKLAVATCQLRWAVSGCENALSGELSFMVQRH